MFVGLNMWQLLCGIVYVYIIIHLYGYAVIKLLQYMTYTVWCNQDWLCKLNVIETNKTKLLQSAEILKV